MTVEKLESLLSQCMELLAEENCVITLANEQPIIQNFFDLKRDDYFLEFILEDKVYSLKSKIDSTVERVEEYESLNEALRKLHKIKCIKSDGQYN